MLQVPLSEVASIVRSKNAGAFWLTFDVMFPDAASYAAVRDSGRITPELVSNLYGRPIEAVKGPYFVDGALAMKVSVQRSIVAGDPDDCDVYGGQQHGPLLGVMVDLPVAGE